LVLYNKENPVNSINPIPMARPPGIQSNQTRDQ
jgi:hypothetical protein